MSQLPHELVVQTLGHLSLSDLQFHYHDPVLRPYTFHLFHSNIIVAKSHDLECSDANDYSIVSHNTYQFNHNRNAQNLRFQNINSFLQFCHQHEQSLCPNILEVESIWDLFPLHKLYPQILSRTKHLKINNPNITHIVNANSTFSDYNNVDAFTINGHANYQTFLSNPNDDFFSKLSMLGLNNVSFDFSLLHSKLTAIHTLEVADACFIDDLKLLCFDKVPQLKNLYIRHLRNQYKLSDLLANGNSALENVIMGNVGSDLNFTQFKSLRELTILSHQGDCLQFLQLPPNLSKLSLHNCRIDVALLKQILDQTTHLTELAIENVALYGSYSSFELPPRLLKLTYKSNCARQVSQPITFILPQFTQDVSVCLSPFFNEIGTINFASASPTTSSITFIDNDTLATSHMSLPDSTAHLDLAQVTLSSHITYQFPQQLIGLKLSSAHNSTNLSNTNIARLSKLENLDLSDNDFAAFEAVELPPSLRCLKLNNNRQLTKVDVADCPRLLQLDLADSGQLARVNLPQSIISLSLKNNDLDGVDLESLASLLKHLVVKGCTNVGVDIPRLIQKHGLVCHDM